MNTGQQISSARQSTINGLAAVGFIALVVAGIWLAIYSTRFVPTVVNGVGGAAVYLGSIFVPSKEPPVLSVVPSEASTTTIPFDTEDSSATTNIVAQQEPVPTIPAKPRPVVTTPGEETRNTYQISGATSTPSLSGLPDFIVSINASGYLATTSTDSFVATSTVPAGTRPAVKFTIKNIGTNVSGQWRFSASIPTQSSYIYFSPFQQSLNPNDSIDYTLGFDRATAGSNKMISVTANFDRAVAESNPNNNSDSVQLTILGS
jgi:hypothetical protein